MEIPDRALKAVEKAAAFLARHAWSIWIRKGFASGGWAAAVAVLEDIRGVGLEWSPPENWSLVFYFLREPDFDLELLLVPIFGITMPDLPVRVRVTGKFRPLCFLTGDSVGANCREQPSGAFPQGSLGGVVSKPDRSQFYLSCNHVLFLNGRVFGHAEGNIVLSPAVTGIEIGRTADDPFFVLTSAHSNLGDWALASVTNPETTRSWLAEDVPLVYPKPVEPSMAIGARVLKRGLTTGLTHGTAIGAKQNFPLEFNTGDIFEFADQLRVQSTDYTRPFAAPGDSGSLVVTEDGHAVGLVFCTDTSEALICPLKPLFDKFNLSFVI